MCDACGKEAQEIDAALAQVEAAHPELTKAPYLGDRTALTWRPDGDGWVADRYDWRIEPMDTGEYCLAHRGQSVVLETLDWAMAWAEVHRLTEGPPGAA